MLHYTKFEQAPKTEWVTFVHGAGGSSSIWFRQIRDFRKHFNVLLIDLRGHGGSKLAIYEKLKRYTFDMISDDIIDVLDHLKIKETHLIGISLGTIIIREMTERYPERVSSLIMGGAVMKLNTKGQFLMSASKVLQSVVPYMVLYRCSAWIILPKKKHRESRTIFINEAKKLYQKEFKRWFTLTAQINPLLKLFRFKDSGVRTLYIMGEDDHMFLPSITELVKDHIFAELHVIPACGHVVNVEEPVQFNSTVIEYLKRPNALVS